eukprot:NODE_129_length_18551_cov_0.317039.p4 type:complete len:326 gc:universal NODE_129_length_18551_cov_0.317039:3683-2706(-)
MITVIAPTNIALVKYWGKSDIDNIVPMNESISVALNIYTTTSVEKSEVDEFILNNVLQDLESHSRIKRCILKFKDLCASKNNPVFSVKVTTSNQLPTASGLASSASGGAALVIALNELYRLNLSLDHLSILARLTSGSACRSVFGGMVKWSMNAPDLESINDLPVPNCRAIPLGVFRLFGMVIIVDKKQKLVPSTVGMEKTVETSSLYQQRLRKVSETIRDMELAINSNDFENLALVTMKDAMNFHACCLDTYPPIHYLNDSSFDIIDKVHIFNKDEVKCAYTFDAGANCVLLFNSKTSREHFKQYIEYEYIECESCNGPQITNK